jgi:predicted permease
MPSPRSVVGLIGAFFRNRRLEGRLRDELQLHVDMLADKYRCLGMSDDEAQRQARMAVGAFDHVREAVRDARGFGWLDEAARNSRYAFRQFRRNPGFTLTAVLVLSLGIGANTAVFSIFYNFLLRNLPVREPERLVTLSSTGPMPSFRWGDPAGGRDERFSHAMFRDLARVQTVFTGLCAHAYFTANLAVRNETQRGVGVLVSGTYFSVLDVRPALGRLLDSRDDAVVGESHAVVLGYGIWRDRFGLDPKVLNQPMVVNGQIMTIVGVAQAGFEGTALGLDPQVFVPVTMFQEMDPYFRGMNIDNRQSHWLLLLARLKPGIAAAQARTALNGPYAAIINQVEAPLQGHLSPQELSYFRTKSIVLEHGAHGEQTVLRATTRLAMLFVVTALVLVIACTNAANLHLARGAARARELGVRLSIGAGRMQVVRQLLTESCLLALLAGCAGLLMAQLTLRLIELLVSSSFAGSGSAQNFALSGPTLLFTAALALGTSLFFGLFPALHSTRLDLAASVKGQGALASGARSNVRFRRALAIGQVSLSLVLLAVAGLFGRSLYNASHADIGLRTDHLVGFTVSPSVNGYTEARSRQLFERLEEELAALPGATSATASRVRLFTGTEVQYGGLRSVDDQVLDPHAMLNIDVNKIGLTYFRTLGIPLLAGREFTRGDTSTSRKVVIVNEAFARRFHRRDLVGRSIRMAIGAQGQEQDIEVVGVARNARHVDPKKENVPQMFFPYRQPDDVPFPQLTFYVRTSVPPDQISAAIRALMARLGPNLPVENLATMQEQIGQSLTRDRVLSLLVTVFACLATLLAAIGLYGVVAYTATQRTREFGLRVALGASRWQIRAMVLREVGGMVLAGSVIGLIFALGAGRLAESSLYQLKGYDPTVLIGSTVTLALVAAAAALTPAWRASRVDPAQTLRFE